MDVYITRLAETREINGLFWAKNLTDLFWAMDEFGDPHELDFAKLKGASGLGLKLTQASPGREIMGYPEVTDLGERVDCDLSDPSGLQWHRAELRVRDRTIVIEKLKPETVEEN